MSRGRRAPKWFVAAHDLLPKSPQRPFAVFWRGHRWAISTDGRAFTALKNTAARSISQQGNLARAVRQIMAPHWAGVVRVTSPASLHRFLAGVKLRGEPDPGEIATGVVVDRRLLKRFMGDLTGSRITLRFLGTSDAVRFAGPGWVVVVMPMRWPQGSPVRLAWRTG